MVICIVDAVHDLLHYIVLENYRQAGSDLESTSKDEVNIAGFVQVLEI